MKTRRLMIVVLILVIGGIAANLPRDWIHGVTPQARMSEVLSAFINLGSDPPESLVKVDWLVRNERLKRLRERRLAHIPPDLIAVYAAEAGLDAAAFRARLVDPVAQDPFETAHAPLVMPRDAPHGQGEGLSWAHVRSQTSAGAPGAETGAGGCGLWLVAWTPKDWFYAPLGTPRAERLLHAAFPGRARMMLRDAPRC